MTSSLSSPARLRELFTPRGIALVGASNTSGWARNIYQSLCTLGFEGRFVPVHPSHAEAFGIPTRPSLRNLEHPVDLAFILAPADAVEAIVNDAAAAGIPNVVVLAGGFAEVGEFGRALEQRLVQLASAAGITLLGPNGLGFVNATERVAPYGLVLTPPVLAGPVGIVLQSGALASAVLTFARCHGIGISLLVSMGNEAMVTTADVVDYLLEDQATQAVALFLEEIRQPARFEALARRALAAGKPLIAMKVGRSPAGQRAAMAHTGAVAGDDAVADAVMRQWGMVRVTSLEELLVTAGLFGYGPRPRGRRLGVVSLSGGACDIVADRADDVGLQIPEFSAETVASLQQLLPPFSRPDNPLDVTGFVLAHDNAEGPTPAARALHTVARDPNLDHVLYLGVVPPAAPDPIVERRLEWTAQIIGASPVAVVLSSTTCTDLSEHGRALLAGLDMHPLAGLDLAVTAIGHSVRWHERRETRRAEVAPPARNATAAPQPPGVWSEIEGRRLLNEFSVRLVPAELATSDQAAVRAAARLGFPVALKACGRGLAHKSDIGAVALGLATATAVRHAYLQIRERVYAHGLEAEGVLVSPMRAGGVELLVGVTVDLTFGPVLAVGIGGIWVETYADVALRVLPIDGETVEAMLAELKGAAQLRGARGGQTVDVKQVVDAVIGIAAAARALGPTLEALEVNPLWCSADRVEALDVRVVTKQEEV